METSKQATQVAELRKGKIWVRANTTSGQEEMFCKFFLETPLGKKWYQSIKASSYQKHEIPDFIFLIESGKKIGLEVTQFIIKDKNNTPTRHFKNVSTLKRTAFQVAEYFNQKHNIPLSILIELYDERQFSPNWNEHLDYLYNPWTPILDINFKELKQLIINKITQKGVPNWGIEKLLIEFSSYKFLVTFDKFYEPYISANVNSVGITIDASISDIQHTINSKNIKYRHYMEACDECHLLIVSEDPRSGNCVAFPDKILHHTFHSPFKTIHLLSLDGFADDSLELKSCRAFE